MLSFADKLLFNCMRDKEGEYSKDIYQEVSRFVFRAVAQLKLHHRTILVLWYFEQMRFFEE